MNPAGTQQKKYIILALSAAALFFWLRFFRQSDANFILILLIGIISLTAILDLLFGNTKTKISRKQIHAAALFSVLFPAVMILSNYDLFSPLKKRILPVILIGAISYYLALVFHLFCIKHLEPIRFVPRSSGKQKTVFLISFALLTLQYSIYLFTSAYPGTVTPDSLSQIYLALTRITSNHHPFYHTLLIRIVLKAGLFLFNDLNAAICCYSIVSLLFMASVFAYILATLYEFGAPKWGIIFFFLMYFLMPYHISYSVTMWKDVVFGISVALFILSEIRILRQNASKKDYILLVISGLGFALFRSNGFFALIIAFILSVKLINDKKYRNLMLVVLLAAFILKYPVLRILDVEQPDIAEFLSIPEQQIARVLHEDVPLTNDEREELSKIMDIRMAAERYNPVLSDPVKNNIRRVGIDYLEAHKAEYFKLWLKLGMRYPGFYMKAWVDQTKGFWSLANHSINEYQHVIANYFTANGMQMTLEDLDITPITHDNVFSRAYHAYIEKFQTAAVLEPFMNIGLHVWAVAGVMFSGCLLKRKTAAVTCIPLLAIIFSLLLSTPASGMHRYAYAVFAAFPLVVFSAMFPDE